MVLCLIKIEPDIITLYYTSFQLYHFVHRLVSSARAGFNQFEILEDPFARTV